MTSSQSADWMPIENRFAKGFSIRQKEDNLRISLASGSEIKLLSTEADGPLEIAIPARRIACLSTTHASYLAALGFSEAVVGVGYAESVLDQEVKKRIENGSIGNITSASGLDLEKLLALSPDVFLTYSYESIPEELIRHAGVKIMYINEYEEPDLLGRAEWIRVFGALVGRFQKADSLFEQVADRYDALRKSVFTSSKSPAVLTASFYGGQWFVPGGDSYAAKLIADAGATYLFHHKEGSGNVAVSFEELYKVAAQADFFGKVAAVADFGPESFFEGDKRFLGLKCHTKGGLFVCNTIEADYFGRASVEPDVLLADLISVFHPDILPNHSPRYFRLIGH
jgi:iron complex transport system substrate-binding protein